MSRRKAADPAIAREVLDAIVAALPGGAPREPQQQMADAVAAAFANHEHLLVEAGTGTGKSIAYLVPAILTGERVVIVTATRALQDQLCRKDLPFLTERLAADPRVGPFTYAKLEGRSNYVCRARLVDLEADFQAAFNGLVSEREAVREIADWAETTSTGARADLDDAVPDSVWAAVSMDSHECPGRQRCELGETCFAERARDAAAAADVIVVNTALYGQHLVGAGKVLPPHSYVVVDEAHTLEEIASGAFAVTMGATRIGRASAQIRGFLTSEDGTSPTARLDERAQRLSRLLEQCPDGERIDLGTTGVRDALAAVNEELASIRKSVDQVKSDAGDTAQKRQRVLRLIDSTREDLAYAVRASGDDDAMWVEARGGSAPPVLHVARIDVGAPLHHSLFSRRTAVLSSATLATGGDFEPVAWRLGLRPELVGDAGDDGGMTPSFGDPDEVEIAPTNPSAFTALDVGSAFDYRTQAILYCAAHLPEPRSPKWADAWLEEAVGLVQAAGGRTLGLCTSLAAAAALREALKAALPDVKVMSPDDLPRAKLMVAFAADETSCLIGSMGLWQGIDVPGPSVTLVIIDKLPFQRPDDPLALARRDRAAALGHDPFQTYDLPRSALLLAQGVGRLVRASTDRGVVAVLDPRLVTKRYGTTLVASLPPMFKMTNPDRVRAALHRLTHPTDD